MASNTANISLESSLNVHPYYDDYEGDKGYYRILFNPSLPVQSRELTQLQTALQKQIDRFGEHVFQEGSIVSGGTYSIDTNYRYAKIEDLDDLGAAVVLSGIVNTVITGTSGTKANVLETVDGLEGTANPKTLYMAYTGAGGANNDIRTFSNNETVVSTSGYRAVVTETGKGSKLTLNSGVIFAKDHFIIFPTQSVFLEKYSSTPYVKVGFQIDEDIITYEDDDTLRDPANGYVFGPPGADRLKLTPNLVSFPVANVPSNFIELFHIRDGVVVSKKEDPQYAVLMDEMAKRTYDESGNYVVEGMNVRIRENSKSVDPLGLYTGGNTSFLAIGIEPGKAYVRGYKVDSLVTTYIPLLKGTDYKNVEQQIITPNYGNYIRITDAMTLPAINSQELLDFYSNPMNAVSGMAPTGTPSGISYGKARARAIEYESGTKGTATAVYRLYLTDMALNTSLPSTPIGIYSATSGFRADTIDNIIYDRNNTTSIFKIATPYVRSIRDANGDPDTTYTSQRNAVASVATDGTFTLNLTGSDIFPYSVGVLNNSQAQSDFHITASSDITTDNYAGTVAVSGTTVTGTGTSFTTNYKVGHKIIINSEKRIIAAIANNTSLTLTTAGSTVTGQTHAGFYHVGDHFDSPTITINSTTSLTIALGKTFSSSFNTVTNFPVNTVDALEKKKLLRRSRYVKINTATHPNGVNGPWCLGLTDVIKINSIRSHTTTFTTGNEGSDVTANFNFDDGQRDDLYKNSSISKKGSALAAGTHLLINLDYYVHDLSQGKGYFSVDSYPVNDAILPSATTIQTKDISTYTSKNGTLYDLRDCIDIRVSFTNAATDSTTVAGASTNPIDSGIVLSTGSVVAYPAPNQNMIMDYSYYLPRKDLVVISEKGIYSIVYGKSDSLPRTPEVLANAMSLAVINTTPWPTLTMENARAVEKPWLGVTSHKNSFRRYTMRDIGVLDDRLNNLEYYTQLSLLEKNTLDMVIPDENGLNRFKNGILVDPFKDHNVGNFTHPDYKCAIDPNRQELRSKFLTNNIHTDYRQGTNVVRKGPVVMLPYTHEPEISQPFATGFKNAAGLFYKWNGECTISPSDDYWTDTTRSPSLQTSIGPNASTWNSLANAWGTNWGDWQTVWTGVNMSSTGTVTSSGNATGGTLITSTNNITTTQTGTQTRTGTQLAVDTRTQSVNLGDRVTDTSLNPYMRGRTIQFLLTGMKPSTRLYVTFDNEDVNAYIRQTDSTGAITGTTLGAPLVTDSFGAALGYFHLPNNSTMRFTTGNKILRFTDNPDVDNEMTFAEATYSAFGISQVVQSTVLSTQIPVFSSRTVSDTRPTTSTTFSTVQNSVFVPGPPVTIPPPGTTTITNTVVGPDPIDPVIPDRVSPPEVVTGENFGRDSNNIDPIGQSFSVRLPNFLPGMFVSKLRLYFRTKDANHGVKIELRTLDSADNVTKTILPGSAVQITSAQMNVSANGATGTDIEFEYPVFLMNNTSYAFVVKPLGNNPNTTLWISKLGETDLISNVRVTQQPYSGVLYESSSDGHYNAVHDEDIKFILYRSKFDPAVAGAFTMAADRSQYVVMDTVTGIDTVGDVLRGEPRVTLNVTSGTITLGHTITFSNGATGTIHALNNGRYLIQTTSDLITTGLTFTTSGGAAGSVTAVIIPWFQLVFVDPLTKRMTLKNITSGVADASGVYVTSAMPALATERIYNQNRTVYGTIQSFHNIPYNVININGSRLDFQLAASTWALSTFKSGQTSNDPFIDIQLNTNIDMPDEKIVQSSENGDSIHINVGMFTQNEYLSPVVNYRRTSAIVVGNIINNDSTNETLAVGGNALAKYLSIPVELNDYQDAEDLKVMLTTYRPPGSNVKVYAKFIHAEDASIMDNIDWIELDVKSSILYSNINNKNDFKEFEYNIPAAYLIGTNDAFKYTRNGATYETFRNFALKIVMLATNTSQIPLVKDMRAIALQR